MKKKKVIAKEISIIVIAIIVAIVIMQVTMKTKVMEQISQMQEENKSPKALDVSSWDTSKVTVYTDPVSGKKAPIPKGYSVSQVAGENLIGKGLVIYEGTEPVTGVETDIGTPGTAEWTASCNRNQWVWVPVEDVSRVYDKSTRKSALWEITSTGRKTYPNSNYEPGALVGSQYADNEKLFSQYNQPGMTKENLLYEIEVGLEETIKSIEKYGGFYIGRYETGKVSKTGSINYVRPVVQRMQGDNSINYVTWYDAYMNLRTLGANENVKANMIYGCMWDETLEWIRESGAKTDAEIYNSAAWGNHLDSESFTYYKDVSGSSTGTKTQNSYTRTPTGSTERNKANNIYDMAGNMFEWTLEGNGSGGRSYRGGYYDNDASGCSVGYRYYYNPNYSDSSRRCACVLLHKIEILLEQNPIL